MGLLVLHDSQAHHAIGDEFEGGRSGERERLIGGWGFLHSRVGGIVVLRLGAAGLAELELHRAFPCFLVLHDGGVRHEEDKGSLVLLQGDAVAISRESFEAVCIGEGVEQGEDGSSYGYTVYSS